MSAARAVYIDPYSIIHLTGFEVEDCQYWFHSYDSARMGSAAAYLTGVSYIDLIYAVNTYVHPGMLHH